MSKAQLLLSKKDSAAAAVAAKVVEATVETTTVKEVAAISKETTTPEVAVDTSKEEATNSDRAVMTATHGDVEVAVEVIVAEKAVVANQAGNQLHNANTHTLVMLHFERVNLNSSCLS